MCVCVCVRTETNKPPLRNVWKSRGCLPGPNWMVEASEDWLCGCASLRRACRLTGRNERTTERPNDYYFQTTASGAQLLDLPVGFGERAENERFRKELFVADPSKIFFGFATTKDPR